MIERIGIVGAGTMGAGIMINCAVNGFDVVLTDRSAGALDGARAKLDAYLARQVQKERIAAPEADRIAGRLTAATENAALAGSDLVIEAVFENLDLKQAIFAEIEGIVSDDAILASNTSCLRLAEIAAALRRKQRFCGLHYFSPAEINPVVELIRGPETAPDVLEKAGAFLSATGKEAIACKDQNGFALNRFFCPYTNEAVRLLDEGLATTGQIDIVAKETFGLALGPFAVMNIVGTATNLNAVRNLAPLGPFYAPAQGLIDHGERGAAWEIEETPDTLDPDIVRKMSDRLTAAVLLPVREELDEGVTTLDDIDKGASLAFRFTNTPGKLLADMGEEAANELVGSIRAAHA